MRKKLRTEILDLLREALDTETQRLTEATVDLNNYIDEHSFEANIPQEGSTEPENEEAPLNTRAEILRTAEELINGDRAQTYGDPEVSFGRIADIFNAMGYRHHVQIPDAPLGTTRANRLDAVDAVLILLGMKLSRTIGGRTQMDNWIDMAGYSGLGAELAKPKWDFMSAFIEEFNIKDSQ